MCQSIFIKFFSILSKFNPISLSHCEIIQEVRDARFGKGSLNQKIAEMCTFMDNVNTTLTKKVNDIQIGTRNYLLNTGLKDNTSSFSGLNNEVVRVTS